MIQIGKGKFVVMVSFPDNYGTFWFKFDSDLNAMAFAEQFKNNLDSSSYPKKVLDNMTVSIHLW